MARTRQKSTKSTGFNRYTSSRKMKKGVLARAKKGGVPISYLYITDSWDSQGRLTYKNPKPYVRPK